MNRPLRHVGLGFGRLDHWHHGLGEFSKQLGLELASRARRLRAEHAVQLHFHLAERWHGLFGPDVTYLPLWPLDRWLHISRTRFDVWHTLHQHSRFQAPVNAREKLLTVHDLNYLYFKSESKINKYNRRFQRLMNRQTAVVTISGHVRNDLSRHLVSPRPAAVVYNGATNLSDVAQVAVPGVVPGGYLLHLSRMAPTKNIDCLLHLAAALPGHSFVFAGPSSGDAAALAQQISDRGLKNAQLRLDVSEGEKAWLLAHCQGFLFPSLAEGFGLPPLEAMNFGKPVFLSRLTSLPEVGGDVAYYFDHFGREHTRDVVLAGLADHVQPGRREATQAHAAGFTWARCADGYIQHYLKLLRD